MKNLLCIISLLSFSIIGYSQARLSLSNNVYVNIGNHANLVIDNDNPNAITLTGSGGNIISENERNVVKWNIGNTTGNYVLPFTNTDGIKIPVEVNINTAGSSDGSFIFSTYRTDNMNTQWPTIPPAVTNMCSSLLPTDASLAVMDRFWRIDANSYTTKPSAILSFGYDYTNEASGSNDIGEANLQAQRFNPDLTNDGTSCHETTVNGNWESLLFGTANTTQKNVEDVIVSADNFFKDWILVDQATPLPITLLNFDAVCEDGFTVLNWTTASENNNDYFAIDKSIDGINFYQTATMQGIGNSSRLTSYSYTDYTPNMNLSYFRLKQVDFDGKQEYFNIISSNCVSDSHFEVSQEVFTDHSLNFNIHTTDKEALTISIYDYSGRLIVSKTVLVKKGSNQIKLSGLNLIKGIYILNIVGEKNQHATKLFKQ